MRKMGWCRWLSKFEILKSNFIIWQKY
jgi:hypothetical protein